MSDILPSDATLSELYNADCPGALVILQSAFTGRPPPENGEIYVNTGKYSIDDGFHLEIENELEREFRAVNKYKYLTVFGSKVDFVRPPAGYPSNELVRHWADVLHEGRELNFTWGNVGEDRKHIARYAFDQLPCHLHAVHPDVLHEVTAKSFITTITCPQARVLHKPCAPSVLKLDRAYGGQGVFIIRSIGQYNSLMADIRSRKPTTNTLLTEYVENQKKNYDAVIFIHKSGGFRWLGTVEQTISDQCRFVGCTCELDPQDDLENLLRPTVEPVAQKMHEKGYFGMVTIDILVDAVDKQYVIDINPRWGVCTPALLGLKKLEARGYKACLMAIKKRLPGPLTTLLTRLQDVKDGKVLLGTACGQEIMLTDFVVYSSTLEKCREIYAQLLTWSQRC